MSKTKEVVTPSESPEPQESELDQFLEPEEVEIFLGAASLLENLRESSSGKETHNVGFQDIVKEHSDTEYMNSFSEISGKVMEVKKVTRNSSERRRRKAVQDSFESLRQRLPKSENGRYSKTEQLAQALHYIKLLQKSNNRLKQEISILKQEENRLLSLNLNK